VSYVTELIARLKYHAHKQYTWGNWDVAELLEEAAYQLEGSNVRILRRTEESSTNPQDSEGSQIDK